MCGSVWGGLFVHTQKANKKCTGANDGVRDVRDMFNSHQMNT